MGFSIYCTNKGCGKYNEPKLDVESDEVICVECGKPIDNITYFAKVQLKSMGQIKRNKENNKAFSVLCNNCLKKDTPNIVKDIAYCNNCNEKLNVSEMFVRAIKYNK